MNIPACGGEVGLVRRAVPGLAVPGAAHAVEGAAVRAVLALIGVLLQLRRRAHEGAVLVGARVLELLHQLVDQAERHQLAVAVFEKGFAAGWAPIALQPARAAPAHQVLAQQAREEHVVGGIIADGTGQGLLQLRVAHVRRARSGVGHGVRAFGEGSARAGGRWVGGHDAAGPRERRGPWGGRARRARARGASSREGERGGGGGASAGGRAASQGRRRARAAPHGLWRLAFRECDAVSVRFLPTDGHRQESASKSERFLRRRFLPGTPTKFERTDASTTATHSLRPATECLRARGRRLEMDELRVRHVLFGDASASSEDPLIR